MGRKNEVAKIDLKVNGFKFVEGKEKPHKYEIESGPFDSAIKKLTETDIKKTDHIYELQASDSGKYQKVVLNSIKKTEELYNLEVYCIYRDKEKIETINDSTLEEGTIQLGDKTYRFARTFLTISTKTKIVIVDNRLHLGPLRVLLRELMIKTLKVSDYNLYESDLLKTKLKIEFVSVMKEDFLNVLKNRPQSIKALQTRIASPNIFREKSHLEEPDNLEFFKEMAMFFFGEEDKEKAMKFLEYADISVTVNFKPIRTKGGSDTIGRLKSSCSEKFQRIIKSEYSQKPKLLFIDKNKETSSSVLDGMKMAELVKVPVEDWSNSDKMFKEQIELYKSVLKIANK